MAESFWATLKTEYYYRRTFTTRDQVDTGVSTRIEYFYNRRSTHTSLGGKSALHNWGCRWGLNPPVSRSARVM